MNVVNRSAGWWFSRIVGTFVAAIAGFVMSVVPANAQTTLASCTVDPRNPAGAGLDSRNYLLVNYKIHVNCGGLRQVQIEQRWWERDSGSNPDDFLGSKLYPWRDAGIFGTLGTIAVSNIQRVPNTETAYLDDEELYQEVRFRVFSNGVTSAWTKWERSGTVSFRN